MAPLEPWEKVLVDGEVFPTTIHGAISCIECHNGIQDPDKEIAHTDLIATPSTDNERVCSKCHPAVTMTYDDSLHAAQTGYWTALDERTAPEDHPVIDEMFGNHCQSCHTICGDCHVSRPQSAGAGFIDGHNFQKTPSMTNNCTACHGSRVGNEYLGKNEDVKSDIHFRQGRMKCTDCHTGHEMHGQLAECDTCHTEMPTTDTLPPDHRYADDDLGTPTCESCHKEAANGLDDITMHQPHGSKLACQVCHSVSYTSCDGCHVQISEETGNPFFATDGTYMTFLIGKNPIQSEQKPYEFITLRHIPVSEDSYAFYGEDLLKNFNALPTWAYTTPHNIQRITPQAESCNACHGNESIFLTADKVAENELEANLPVIVENVPAVLGQ